MPTKIEICNLALNRIAANPVTSLDEGTASAKAVNLVYDQAIAELLAKHHWIFARKRRDLSPLADPELPPNWALAYTLPTDMVRFMYIEGYDITPSAAYPWHARPQVIGFHADHEIIGGTIFTNIQDAVAIYTALETNTALFPPLVTNAFIELLAARMVMPVKSDERRYGMMLGSAMDLINEAIAADMNNQSMSMATISTFEQAR